MYLLTLLVTLFANQVLSLYTHSQYAPIVELEDGKVRGLIQEAKGVEPVKQAHAYIGMRYGNACIL